jgi:N-acetylglutamate synthase-like GNAT family acetyltransferase
VVKIVSYQAQYKAYIKSLNYEWLEKYFWVEDNDALVLSNPEEYILNKGGQIYFALDNDKIVGTASLLRISNTTFELGKMAVTNTYQGKGIGKMLLEHCLEAAKNLEISNLILYSNTKLETAITLYKNYGFIKVPMPTDVHYERANIKMEKVL